MERILDITKTKTIQLDNVKVSFKVKLLQYNINNLLYEYNNKYAFPPFISKLKKELTSLILDSNLKDNNEAQELIKKTRIIYKQLDKYNPNITDIDNALDNTLRFLLYQFNNKKGTITLQEEIKLIQELKIIQEIIKDYNLHNTDRINNSIKLYNQLKSHITETL